MMELPLIALMLVAPVEMERKCPVGRVQLPGYASNEPVTLLDGVVVPRREGELGFSPETEMASVEITCWDPDTNAFSSRGVMVVRIQTRDLVEATRAPLLQLIEAQEAFRERHGHPATDLASLAEFGFPPENRPRLRGDPGRVEGVHPGRRCRAPVYRLGGLCRNPPGRRETSP